MDDRKRLVRLIHVAKRELSMSEDGYRDALAAATKKRSTSDMTILELERAVAHMKKCGFKVRVSPAKPKTRAVDDAPTSSKLRSLWLSLAGMTVVRDPAEAALAHWVERETGIAALQWLSSDQASECIEKMKKWHGRVLRQRRGEILAALGYCGAMPVSEVRRVITEAAQRVLGRAVDVDGMSAAEFEQVKAAGPRVGEKP